MACVFSARYRCVPHREAVAYFVPFESPEPESLAVPARSLPTRMFHCILGPEVTAFAVKGQIDGSVIVWQLWPGPVFVCAAAALGACRALGRARVGPAKRRRLGAKRSRVGHPASICNDACAPLQAQPEGPGRFAVPSVVAGSLCGPATRPRRRLGWRRDSPRRGPDPKPDRLLAWRISSLGVA